ncbi:MAG: hypothetical protein HOK30_05150 [Rhodospirillaceae bacterium]|jgi:hypothetical protein|nr:hypothetical protein [Rhodospirillaceae bacterium]MBT5193327.1 hypothetical protein [Rhodospirillaceae bacterium]MBT5894893.1 hypothetical protein [Rhodospirillaceae bacterium]MBT6427024.1 hypothetical protein [Rhodospirillaceae bacterium]MBT7758111.1 hypothetical protein [Rhodospirillaceae bacterium]
MKIKIDIDCTPAEARAFLGLPDVAPMQEALLAEMQKRMKDAVAGADLESMLKTWMPSGLQGLESMQKAFWAQTMGLNEDKD